MIDKIFVSGFRSLNDLNLDIHPGLNILIGPNGSGKTNLIAFFQFLSHLASSTLAHAISAAGGAGAIFQKIGVDTYHPEFQATVNGRIESPRGYNRQTISKYLYYRYEIKLSLSKERNVIYMKSETLSEYMANKSLTKSQTLNADFDWDITVERLQQENGESRVNLKKFNESRLRNMLRKSEYSNRDLTKLTLHSWVSRYLICHPYYELPRMTKLLQCMAKLTPKHLNRLITLFSVKDNNDWEMPIPKGSNLSVYELCNGNHRRITPIASNSTNR